MNNQALIDLLRAWREEGDEQEQRETFACLQRARPDLWGKREAMIKPDAHLSIRLIPLEALQVKEYQQRYPSMLTHYLQLLQEHPGEYAGLINVVPSDTHKGMYAIQDGHTRFCASIMAGRRDALCVVIEEAA